MRWTVHSEKQLYEDEWLNIRVADVELPGGRHLEHRLIRTPPGAGAVIVVDGRVLLMWRHRFITDTNGWEIPIGKIDPGEEPAEAAARETEEEQAGGRGHCSSCSGWSRRLACPTQCTTSTVQPTRSAWAARRTTSSPTAWHGCRLPTCPG